MKKIILSAAILFAFGTATQAQFSTGNLLNKAKDKAKQEAEKAFTKGNKKEEKKNDKNNPTGNTSKNETMTEEQTTTAPAADYSGMNNTAYVKALGHKENVAMALRDLNGGNAEAINYYYDKAAEVDLANFYPIMLKKGKPSGFDGVSDYESLMKLQKDYPEIYETRFKPAINQTLDGAYQVMKTNRALAVANVEVANHLNEACLLIVSDMKNALELRGELSKALTSIGAEHAKVFTSDFHKKNAGKILFSKEPIVPGKEDPAQFTTSFGPNDYIYGIAYLTGSIWEVNNMREGDNNIPGQYRMSLDGSVQPLFPQDFNHNLEDRKNAYFLIEVRPDPAKAMHGIDATYFADKFAEFSPRKHTVKIGFGSYQAGDPFAEGEFKLDWTNGDAEKIKADAKVAVAKAQFNYAKTVQLDPVFSKPSYQFKDPGLSVANLKKAIMASDPNVVQILKLVVVKHETLTDDWGYARNEYGTILGKATNHFAEYVYKAKDGYCYTHFSAQFGKKASGGGGYGSLVVYPTGLPDQRIACENVK